MRPHKSKHAVLPEDAHPCVWMTAGIVTYKLCDRELDCDNCPLDAALRGAPGGGNTPARKAVWKFPDDRSYGHNHTWVQMGRPARIGLDAFGAQLLPTVTSVRTAPMGKRLESGEVACELETAIGRLPLHMPAPGRLVSSNGRLQTEPRLVERAPYRDGWLMMVELDREDGLLSADAICDKVRLDLQRFRRQVAMHLLTASDVGPVMADGGELITDLPQMLGAHRYLSLVAELLS